MAIHEVPTVPSIKKELVLADIKSFPVLVRSVNEHLMIIFIDRWFVPRDNKIRAIRIDGEESYTFLKTDVLPGWEIVEGPVTIANLR